MAKPNKKIYSKIIYLVIILFVGGFLYLLFVPSKQMPDINDGKINTRNQPQPGEDITPLTASNILILGKAEAPVTLVEYLDYKCPNCGSFHTKAGKQIQQEYVDAGIVKIELRAYPFLGPDSARALRGSYCANDIGKLKKYHDNVFSFIWENYYKNGNYKIEIEDILTADKLVEISRFDETEKLKFRECINSDAKNEFIDRDLNNAANDGVQGTPTILIGDQKIVGPQPFNIYKQLIDIEKR